MKTCLCCHGNKNLIIKRYAEDCKCCNGSFAKNRLHWASVSKVTKTCICCHGSKKSIATRFTKYRNCPKISLCEKSTPLGFSVNKVIHIAMVTRIPWQQDFPSIAIAPRDPSTKNQLYWASVSKVTMNCPCCHGNKNSIATR